MSAHRNSGGSQNNYRGSRGNSRRGAQNRSAAGRNSRNSATTSGGGYQSHHSSSLPTTLPAFSLYLTKKPFKHQHDMRKV